MQLMDSCAEPASHSFSLEQAVERITAAINPVLDTELVPLAAAKGRILAQPYTAPFPLPPFRNSAMDGYALSAADLDDPINDTFHVIGKSFAGHPYPGSILKGQCVRIFTGAPVPASADTVVMQEHVNLAGDRIVLNRRPVPRANVRPEGDDAPAGQELLGRGKRLTAADIGLLASAGLSEVMVIRKLRVAHCSTGDELTPLGTKLEFGQIYDSNRYLLGALLCQPFIETKDFGIVRDDPESIALKLKAAASWGDVVLSSGGVSVGDADFVTGVIAEIGRMEFWKIAVKPGKPFAFGRLDQAWFCGLPGNPVAVLVSFLQLVRPLLLSLTGMPPSPPFRLSAVCTEVLRKSPGRMEFQRGVFRNGANGEVIVSPCGAQGSHRLSGASEANCLIVLAADCAGVDVGSKVEIEPLCEIW